MACEHRCGCTSDMTCPHWECPCGGDTDDDQEDE